MRTLIRLFICVSIALCSVTTSYAQDPEGWNDGDSADVPLDGGLSLLLAAGIGYGASKYNDRKKKSQQQNTNEEA